MKKFFAQVCVLLCIIIAPAFALCACESERPQYTFDNTDRCTYTLGDSRKRKMPRADVMRLLFRLIARLFHSALKRSAAEYHAPYMQRSAWLNAALKCGAEKA